MSKQFHTPCGLYLVVSRTDPNTTRLEQVEKISTPNSDDLQQMEKTLDRIIQMIGNCDQKASYLLAMVGVAATIFLVSDVVAKIKNILIDPFLLYWKDDIGSFCILRLLIAISLIGGLICIFFSLLQLLKSISSNTDYSALKQPGMSEKSFIFFKHIAEMSYEDFSSNKNDRYKDLCSQTYVNAKICTAKFDHYRKGLCLLKAAIYLLTVAFVLFLF